MKHLIKLANTNKRIPILACIRIKDGIATATDMDVYIDCPTDQSDGVYNANAVAAGVYKDANLPVEDFPEMLPLSQDQRAIAVSVESLTFVAIAQSTEETRYYLNGVLFDARGIVATDGHRLHMVKAATDCGDDKYILPRGAVKILLAFAKDEKVKELRVKFSENGKFMCNVGKYHVKGKLVDGTFPDYMRVIPSAPEHETVFKVGEFKGTQERSDCPAQG